MSRLRYGRRWYFHKVKDKPCVNHGISAITNVDLPTSSNDNTLSSGKVPLKYSSSVTFSAAFVGPLSVAAAALTGVMVMVSGGNTKMNGINETCFNWLLEYF